MSANNFSKLKFFEAFKVAAKFTVYENVTKHSKICGRFW